MANTSAKPDKRRLTRLIATPRGRLALVLAAGVIAVVAWLAFGFFGIQGLFIDDKVDEADPFTVTATVTGSGSATPTTAAAPASSTTVPPGGPSAPATTPPSAGRTTFTSVLGSRSHKTTGQAAVVTDGTTSFLRLIDLATDNGPDVFVYLSAGVNAQSPEGQLDDDFVNLGKLKGNIGSQNYQLPPDIDLRRYKTVVLWCKRFSSAFGTSGATPAA